MERLGHPVTGGIKDEVLAGRAPDCAEGILDGVESILRVRESAL